MISVVQRVKRALIRVDNKEIASNNGGLVVFCCLVEGDTEDDLVWMAKKICGLRIFEDPFGKMNLSVSDIGGSILLVSQFTLAADVKKGMRPSFNRAMEPQRAEKMFEQFVDIVQKMHGKVQSGRFRAHMEIELTNDGPVTIIIDTGVLKRKR